MANDKQEVSELEWKDETSYSQGERGTSPLPRVYGVKVGIFRVAVHRLHKLDGWFLSVEGICHDRQLRSTAPLDAQQEAIALLRDVFTKALEALND